MSNIQDTNIIPELQSPFEQLREVDADGKEWWNSRKLARVMGYGKYWNFERVIAKAQAWTSQKGYHLGEHFVEITEMAELFGVTQQNISYHLQQIEESGELHLSDAYKKILLPSDKWSIGNHRDIKRPTSNKTKKIAIEIKKRRGHIIVNTPL